MMLKIFFWILLLGNAGLFAYQQGYFDVFLPSGREPSRMKQQINADKFRLVPAPDPNRVPAPEPAEAPAAVPAPAPTPAPAPVPAPAPAVAPTASAEVKKAAVAACTEIGNFNPEEARRFSEQVATTPLGDKLSRRAIQEVANHMVYIPPQADREAAEKKAGELRQLGVEDFFIIQDNSSLRWGISLGVFKQEEAARAHLAALTQKGVRSARIGQRTVTSNLVAFQLRDLDEAGRRALDKIRAGFPKQEARKCDPA